MKFLEILLSFLASQGKSFLQTNTEAVTHQIVNNARRVVVLLALTVIFITLFCIGFSLGYSGIVNSLEHGSFSWSPALIAGLVLTFLSAGGLVYSLGEKRWLTATGLAPSEEHAHAQAPSGTTLESAFAVLIVELANELKEKRKHVPKTAGDTAQV